MAVSYEELEGSPRFSVQQDNYTARRIFKVAWEDIDEFLEEFFGAPGFVAGERVRNVRPKSFSSSKSWLIVDDVDIEPFDPSNPGPNDIEGVATYPEAGAKVTVNYVPKPYDNPTEDQAEQPPEGIDFYSHEVTSSGEFITLPQGALKWEDGLEVPPEIRAGKLISIQNHKITLHYLPRPPWTAIKEYSGCVNASKFWDWEPETALFAGSSIRRRNQTWSGERLYEVEYNFAVRSVIEKFPLFNTTNYYGWNHFLRPPRVGPPVDAASAWERIYTKAGNQPIYPAVNFANLFKFEPFPDQTEIQA